MVLSHIIIYDVRSKISITAQSYKSGEGDNVVWETATSHRLPSTDTQQRYEHRKGPKTPIGTSTIGKDHDQDNTTSRRGGDSCSLLLH